MAWRTGLVKADFYNEEERSGYKVTSKQKKIWAVELDLMNELLRVCNKYSIGVSAFAGTLLGAVRHKGFIPWDDDMDVCMTRADFNRLCEIADEEFSYPYFFQTARSDKEYYIPYGCLRNSETTGIIVWHDSPNYNNGIFIDIFVLDGFIENRFLFWIQYLEWRAIRSICENYNHLSKMTNRWLEKYFLNKVWHYIGKIHNYDYWIEKYESVVGRYTDKSDRLALYDLGRWFLRHYWVYKDELDDIIWVPFENITVPIPRAYDIILKRIYGDYMQFPPEEERGAWHEDKILFDPDMSFLEYYKQKEQ